MTIQEDRETLEQIRGWSQVPENKYNELLRQQMGVGAFDQMASAAKDAGEFHAGLIGKGPFKNKGQVQNMTAELVAGVLRCLKTNYCEHAPSGGRPLKAFLAARVIACDACLTSFFDQIADHDDEVRQGEDRYCDFCLEESEHFYPSAVHFGPAVLIGDMCEQCFERKAHPSV